MLNYNKIKVKSRILKKKYKLLLEKSYNFRETDSALSDVYAYDAFKILNEINRLKYFEIDFSHKF